MTPPFLPPAALAPLGPARPSPTGDGAEAIAEAARAFEAAAVAELLKPMFEALDTQGLGGGGSGEAMFRPMLVDEYAKRLVERGGLGLADAVTRELIALQANRETR